MHRLIILILSAIAFAYGCSSKPNPRVAEPHPALELITTIQAHFVPDRRVNRLDVEMVPRSDGTLVLRGETTLPIAKDSLLSRLRAAAYQVVDSIRLLPAAELGEHTWGLTRVSVANMRSAPGHSQELATQALLGTPVRVLQKNEEWYQVQTPDGYLAWLNQGELVRLGANELARWRQSTRLVYTPLCGRAYQDASPLATPYGDLVAGCILEQIGTRGAMTQVRYPDSSTAYVLTADLVPWAEWCGHADGEVAKAVVQRSVNLHGIPYLWGGTSPKGMDCSGFTKTLYWQQGLILPRDASQQLHAGVPVSYTEDLSGLTPGDFLFFGRYRQDGSPKVTHVSIYLGDGNFIHAGADNGGVRIQNLLPTHPEYAAHRRASLMYARRMQPGSTGVVPLREHPWY
ncbi:MAG: glycoside hydrolase [Bacteroidetes bacterium]|nr:MAG: glycoside hydrolase [Bacteroidota bacterium]